MEGKRWERKGEIEGGRKKTDRGRPWTVVDVESTDQVGAFDGLFFVFPNNSTCQQRDLFKFTPFLYQWCASFLRTFYFWPAPKFKNKSNCVFSPVLFICFYLKKITILSVFQALSPYCLLEFWSTSFSLDNQKDAGQVLICEFYIQLLPLSR